MRLFWALDLPEDAKARLLAAQDALRAACPQGVRWTRPEQLHVTCKFLGEAEDPAPILAAVEALPRPGVLSLELSGLGTFGGRSPRVVWAGLAGPGVEGLKEIARALESAHEPLGFARETRSFKPHVTLGRAKGRGGGPKALAHAVKGAAMEPLAFAASELVLYRSTFGEGRGPVRYEPVGRYSFSG